MNNYCLYCYCGFRIIHLTINGTRFQSTNAYFTPPTCLVRVGGVNTIMAQDKTLSCLEMRCGLSFVFFCIISTQFPICNCSVSTILRTTKTVLSCRQFCLHRRHGQDETILSCPCQRCEIGIMQFIMDVYGEVCTAVWCFL